MDGAADRIVGVPAGLHVAPTAAPAPFPHSIPSELRELQTGLAVRWMEGRPAEPSREWPRRTSLALKRIMDIAGATAGLILLAPLLLFVAAGICLSDRGPVFFRQTRIGRDGKTFEILKFRSMYVDHCDRSGTAAVMPGDHRITPIGAFIRRTSIDELPQLINVLSGDMSLVGPRPHVPHMRAAGLRYEELVPHYDFRHRMRPGLTGWAQCNGLRGPTIDRRRALQRVGHDFAYVQNFSLAMDLAILGRTLASELWGGRIS